MYLNNLFVTKHKNFKAFSKNKFCELFSILYCVKTNKEKYSKHNLY